MHTKFPEQEHSYWHLAIVLPSISQTPTAIPATTPSLGIISFATPMRPVPIRPDTDSLVISCKLSGTSEPSKIPASRMAS